MYKFFIKHNQLVFGLVFISYFVYTLINAFHLGFKVAFGVFLCLILYIQSVTTFLHYYKLKGIPRLIDWMRIALFFYLVLDFMKLVNLSGGKTSIDFIDNYLTNLTDAPFTLGTLIIAYFSLEIGNFIYKEFKIFKIGKYRKNRKLYFRIKGKNKLLILFVISTLVEAYFLLAGISGYGSRLDDITGSSSFIKNVFGNLNQITLILSSYVVFIEHYKNTRYRNTFFLLIGAQALLGLISGMKESFLIPILYSGIAFLMGGGRIKKQYLFIGIAILLLLYPLNNEYRNVINDPFLNKGNNSIIVAFNNLLDQPFVESLQSGTESYRNRTSMYGYLQNSIQSEPLWGYYKHMNRYLVLPIVWLIPRSFWPNKPRADVGAVYNDQLVGRTTNSITPTNIGWAYFEGGIGYVIIIFILIGMFFSMINSSELRSPIIFFLFVWCLHKAIKPEWDPYFMFSSAIQSFVLCWFLLRYVVIKKYVYK